MQKGSVEHILQDIKWNSCNVLIMLLSVIIKNYSNVAARGLCQEWNLRLTHREWSLLLSQTLSDRFQWKMKMQQGCKNPSTTQP